MPAHSETYNKVKLEEGSILHVSLEGGKEKSSPKQAIWHIAGRSEKGDHIKAQVKNGVLTIH